MITQKSARTYAKIGAIQDTAYWSEDATKKVFESTKVKMEMNRPSLSNTVVMKAGSTFQVKIGVLQVGPDVVIPDAAGSGNITTKSRAFGEGTVEWYIAESSFSGATSLIVGAAAGVSLLSSALLF